MVFIAYKTYEMPVVPVGRSAGSVTVKTVAGGSVSARKSVDGLGFKCGFIKCGYSYWFSERRWIVCGLLNFGYISGLPRFTDDRRYAYVTASIMIRL